MDKVAWFVVTVAIVFVGLAFINALSGYTSDNIAAWVVGRIR